MLHETLPHKEKERKAPDVKPMAVCVSCLWDEHLPTGPLLLVPWLSLESVQSLTFGAPAQSTSGPLQSWFPLSPPAARELSQSDTPAKSQAGATELSVGP